MQLKTDGKVFYLVCGEAFLEIPDEAIKWIETDDEDGMEVLGIILRCTGRMDDELFVPGNTMEKDPDKITSE